MTEYIKAIATGPDEETLYVPMTEEEIAERQAEEVAEEQERQIQLEREAQQATVKALASELRQIFDTLDDDAQALFYQTKTQISDALREGRKGVAKKIIENIVIPNELSELENKKNQMLELFE